jgi:hypothetical protein
MKRLSTATLFAFETALSLNPSHRILHTEFADVAYQLRAHLVRGVRTASIAFLIRPLTRGRFSWVWTTLAETRSSSGVRHCYRKQKSTSNRR